MESPFPLSIHADPFGIDANDKGNQEAALDPSLPMFNLVSSLCKVLSTSRYAVNPSLRLSYISDLNSILRHIVPCLCIQLCHGIECVSSVPEVFDCGEHSFSHDWDLLQNVCLLF